MVKHDGEVDTLGQLVVSLTVTGSARWRQTGRSWTWRNESLNSEKRASELETSRNVQDLGETKIPELERKQIEPASA